MISVAHFLVTRFNLRPDYTHTWQLDERWLGPRFELFERFCFPTVRGQTEQVFQWLVLFDISTPESFRRRIEGYARWQNFNPVFVDPGTNGAARKSVEARLAQMPLPDVLLTTRLDNDDGMCRTFMEELRAHADVPAPTILNFPVGYVWHRGRLYRYHFPLNAFATFAEPASALHGAAFRTVYTGSHTDVAQLGRVIEVNDRPSWLQVVHGGNLENRRRGVREARARLRENFDIDEPLTEVPEGAVGLYLETAYTAACTGAGDWCRAALKSASRAIRKSGSDGTDKR